MIRNGILAVIGTLLTLSSFAQITVDSTDANDGEPEIMVDRPKAQRPAVQQKKKNIFLGGWLNLGFGSGGSAVGVNPIIGYSPNKNWDLGLGMGYNYNSIGRDYTYDGVKRTQSNFALGPLVRFFPIDFLFVQGQFEQNWGSYKYGGSQSFSINASSLIGSVGYVNRMQGGNYFFSIGMDFLKNEYSPYRDVEYDSEGRITKNSPIPIIRAGVNFYLW